MAIAAGWPFRFYRYIQRDAEGCVFYPGAYSRGYRLDSDEEARLRGELTPFLEGRLRIEFIGVAFVVLLALTVAMMLMPLDLLLTTPHWVVVVAAFAVAAVMILVPMVRARRRIAGLLAAMKLEPDVPARPDFFIVDGAFSLERLSYAAGFIGLLLAGIRLIAPQIQIPAAAWVFVVAATLLLFVFGRLSR